jgi:hypothetical protein
VTLSFLPEIGPGGLPYVTDNAQLGDQGATVWVEATPAAAVDQRQLGPARHGRLRLPRLDRDGPQSAGGRPHRRERHRRLRRHLPPARHVEHRRHADLARLLGGRRAGWPAAGRLQPVPGAALNAVNWARNVNIHEIQAANGGG